jgi:hypothetical protein
MFQSCLTSRPLRLGLLLAWTALVVAAAVAASPRAATAQDCTPLPDNAYATLPVNPPPTNPPAVQHPDLNLDVRGYAITAGRRQLVDLNGDSDPGAPQMAGLFGDQRTPAFTTLYKVHDWDWGCVCPGEVLTRPHTSLLGLATTPDEVLHVPNSGYTLGNGFEVLVLYASPERITLKYTADDSVVEGYTLHAEGVCVDPALVALYESSNAAGRSQLPALRPGQPFARARSTEIAVAIRDRGTFMDPRSRKDWWQGR